MGYKLVNPQLPSGVPDIPSAVYHTILGARAPPLDGMVNSFGYIPYPFRACGLTYTYAGGDPIPRYGGGTGGNTYSFTCIGHENRLINCESGLLNVGLWCSHDDDAGVTCRNNGILMYLYRIV